MKSLFIALIAISLLGAGVTGYLSYVHYSGGTPVCPIGAPTGCATAVTSSYGQFGAIPVALAGFVLWVVLLYLSIRAYRNAQQTHLWMMFVLSGTGVIAAGYFNAIMFAKLGTFCIWCETAHALILSKFFLTGYMTLGNQGKWFTKTIVAALVLFTIPFAVAASTGPSGEALLLSQYLTAHNFTMYGASWCPHCAEQKSLFGSAFENIDYVECALDGSRTEQTAICVQQNITSYPTWDHNGERRSGVISLRGLEQWSGYPN